MKPIDKTNRLVKNVSDGRFEPFETDGEIEEGQTVLQLDRERAVGTGFHIYKMAPGSTTKAHEHQVDEHFFLVEGDMTDHDGYEYKPGDLVLLKQGTRHRSTSKNGCTLVVYFSSGKPGS